MGKKILTICFAIVAFAIGGSLQSCLRGMPKLIIVIFMAAIMCSCGSQGIKVNVQSVELVELAIIDSTTIDKMAFFASLHYFRDYVILINMYKKNDVPVLNFYSAEDLRYCFSFLHYGRGPNEIIDVNPYYFSTDGDFFTLNTNHYYLSDYEYNLGKITQVKDIFMADLPINNLFITSEGSYICESEFRGAGKEFQIGKMRGIGEAKYFSDYPRTTLKYDDRSDLANICHKMCVGSKEADRYISFYLFLPLIRLFDLKGREIRRIEIADYKQRAISSGDIYNEDCTVFFVRPLAIQDHIFVLFMADGSLDSCQLLKFSWDGQLESRYSLKGGIMSYTISNDQKYCYVLTKNHEDNDIIVKYQLPDSSLALHNAIVTKP